MYNKIVVLLIVSVFIVHVQKPMESYCGRGKDLPIVVKLNKSDVC